MDTFNVKMHREFKKDNTLAYLDGEESDEERNARKVADIEGPREAEVEAAVVRRKKLTELVIREEEEIGKGTMNVTEEDLKMIHGEEEYRARRERHKCCRGGKYVDPELDDPRVQLWFIVKALLPVMLSYIPAFIFPTAMVLFDEIRVYFYNSAPTYVLISFGCWLGLNVFGRLIRPARLVIPLFVMRAAAICQCFGALQIYTEYIIWEFINFDPFDLETQAVVEMEERLRDKHPFPESWLNLEGNGTKLHDLSNRDIFTRVYFGGLLGFSFFISVFSIILTLCLCAGKKKLTRDNVTGDWIKRIAAITAILPSLVLFGAVYNFEFTYGPRSFDLGQIYASGIISLVFAIHVSAFWKTLFAGEAWFNVWKDDYFYFGYTYSI